MKCQKYFLGSFLILMLPIITVAQNITPNPKMFFGSGIAFPVTTLNYESYNDNYKFSGGVTGGFDFGLYRNFSFRTAVSYQKLRFDEFQFSESTDILNSGFNVDGGTETLFGLMGDIKYRFRNWFPTPYIITGAGAYRLTHRNIYFPENAPVTVSENISYWAPSLKVGTGIAFDLFNNWGFFTEINFVINFPESGDNIMHVPVTLGVTF